jgi:hypothetical protein
LAHTTSSEKLIDRLNEHRNFLGNSYYHYKDKSVIYIIRDIVLIEADESIGIVYSREDTPELKWLRSFENFFNEIEFEGEKVKRFIKIDN